MKKRYIYLFLILLLLPIIRVTATTSILPTTNYYNVDINNKIYDYADLFTEEQEKELYNNLKKLIDKNNIDIIITTTKDNPEKQTSTFTEYFYDRNGFGKGTKNDGIILVIDMENREYYIDTVGEVQLIITESRMNTILDNMQPNMINGNYYEAALSFLNTTKKYYNYHNYGPPLLWISTIPIAALIAFFILKKEKNKLKLVKDELEANNYLIEKEIEYKNDIQTDEKVRTIIRKSSSSSGSSRRSSGGSRHRGGGRRF